MNVRQFSSRARTKIHMCGGSRMARARRRTCSPRQRMYMSLRGSNAYALTRLVHISMACARRLAPYVDCITGIRIETYRNARDCS